MPRSKRLRRPRKQRKIRTRLMQGIILIMLLSVLVPVIAYNNLPEWVYYLTPATRLWIVTNEIEDAYESGELLQKLKDTETHYDTAIEVTAPDGTLLYSTQAKIDELPETLSEAEIATVRQWVEYYKFAGTMFTIETYK